MKKLFIIFAILCLAAPAMAADWNFYGSARMETFWTDNDVGPAGAQADDMDLKWTQYANSRIGATVKFNDQIGGKFEMSDSFGKRQLFGTYTFGNGTELLLGQTYGPASSYFYSFSGYGGDNNLLGMGQFYVGRKPMIQMKMGSFKVALIEPNTGGTAVKGDNDDAVYGVLADQGGGVYAYETVGVTEDTDNAVIVVPATGAFEVKDTDVTLPKIELSYKFKTDMFFADVFGGYQTYTLDGAAKDYDIDSYVVGLGGGLNMGAFFLNAGVHMGQNLANYGAAGFLGPNNLASATATAITALKIGAAGYDAGRNEIVDNDGLGYLAVLGFNLSEMLSFEAGYGHMEYEDDANGAKTDSADQYYVNATINIAPGFFIVPEVGMVEWELDGVDLNDYIYYGARWQINF